MTHDSERYDIRPVPEGDVDELLRNGLVSFGPLPASAEAWLREHVIHSLAFTLGSYQDDRLASTATVYPFEAWIGGARHRVGGLASVATAPWARRRGHVAELLKRWLARLHDEGVGWCAEHPFDPRFYGRYGFESLPNGQVVEVPPEVFGEGRPPDADALGPDDASQLRPIHAAFATRYGFALTRDDDARDAWENVLKPWGGAARHAFLLEDAYVVFRISDDGNGTLYVTDYAYANAEGRRRLWSFVAAFRGQARQVQIHLPPGEPLLADHQPRQSVRSPLLQVRLVDLAKALAPLRAPRASSWRIRLHDPLCSWNDGTFTLALSPEGCSATRTEEPADATLDVRPLVALLGQAAPPELLLANGRVRGELDALRALAELTRAQPTFHAQADGF
ncbi:MAG: GNAT family N-acetyltransferase [Deinococcales bacterium]